MGDLHHIDEYAAAMREADAEYQEAIRLTNEETARDVLGVTVFAWASLMAVVGFAAIELWERYGW
jgi:hypothetical protein